MPRCSYHGDHCYLVVDNADVVPPPILLQVRASDDEDSNASDGNGTHRDRRLGHPRHDLDTLNSLFRLDSALRPGLTAAEFRRIIVRCPCCGLIMTKRALTIHRTRPGQVLHDDSELEV